MRVTRQRSLGAYFFMRARYIFVRSTEETARERISGASCVTGQNATSSRFFGAPARAAARRSAANRCGPLTGDAARQSRMEGEGRLGAVRDVDLAQALVAGEAAVDAPQHHLDLGVLETRDRGARARPTTCSFLTRIGGGWRLSRSAAARAGRGLLGRGRWWRRKAVRAVAARCVYP